MAQNSKQSQCAVFDQGRIPTSPFRISTLIPARGPGSAVNSPSGVLGGAPAENEFCAL